jgi:hypothetical protein
MCAMLLATRGSHWSVNTGLPESAWKVTGVTKCVAASVITTCTGAFPDHQTEQFGRLVGGDAAGDAEYDAFSCKFHASGSSRGGNGVAAHST